jgi:hypothetical protein
VVDVGGAALHLGEVDEAGLVEVGESAPFGADGVDAPVEAGQFGGEEFVVGRGGVGGDGVFAGGEDVGAQQGVAELVEDERVEGFGADVAFGAASVLPAGSDRVVVAAVVVAVPGAVAATHLVTVHTYLARAALDQATQHPLPGLGPSWAPPAVVARDLVHRSERLFIHNGRDGDGDPLLAGAGYLLGASTGPVVGDRLGAVEVHPAHVGLVVEDAADRGGAPDRPAPVGWRHAVGVQSQGDLPGGVARAGVVIEDAPHHGGFGFEDQQSGWAGRVACLPVVAVRGPPRDDLPGPGAEQLAPPVPFGDLRPFVLGDDALHLGEQLRLRVVVNGWGVGKADGHTMAGQFVEHDDLVGVDPSQPVRRQAPHRLDQPGLGDIPQRVQAGPVEPGTGVPVVAELSDQLVALGRHPLPQQRQLRADGAALLLTLGGHPRVDRDPHPYPTIRSLPCGPPWPAASSSRANPAASASRRGSAYGLHFG